MPAFNTGVGSVVSIARGISHRGPSDSETLAKIPTADPKAHFSDLLALTGRRASRTVREAATARLRLHPQFMDTLANQLGTGGTNEREQALEFLYSATLSPQDAARLAGPARGALGRFVSAAPAPNYTTKQRMKEVRKWGTEMFDVLPKKFAGTGVDFAESQGRLRGQSESAEVKYSRSASCETNETAPRCAEVVLKRDRPTLASFHFPQPPCAPQPQLCLHCFSLPVPC